MTLYTTFHLATTGKGLSVCAHPAPIFQCMNAEIFGPFEDEEDAGQFVNAIIEGQNHLFEQMSVKARPEAAVQLG